MTVQNKEYIQNPETPARASFVTSHEKLEDFPDSVQRLQETIQNASAAVVSTMHKRTGGTYEAKDTKRRGLFGTPTRAKVTSTQPNGRSEAFISDKQQSVAIKVSPSQGPSIHSSFSVALYNNTNNRLKGKDFPGNGYSYASDPKPDISVSFQLSSGIEAQNLPPRAHVSISRPLTEADSSAEIDKYGKVHREEQEMSAEDLQAISDVTQALERLSQNYTGKDISLLGHALVAEALENSES